jgi:hypothetical protein
MVAKSGTGTKRTNIDTGLCLDGQSQTITTGIVNRSEMTCLMVCAWLKRTPWTPVAVSKNDL